MGCNSSKATKTSYNSMGNKKRHSPTRPVWYNREWDSVTDSQINTTSTYLEKTGASSCSLRRDGGDTCTLRGVGDGQEGDAEPDGGLCR